MFVCGGGGWWWYWTEYKQKSEQVLEYKEREGGREWSRKRDRESMCVLQKVNVLSGEAFSVSNKQGKQVSHCEKEMWVKFQTASF